MNSDLLQRLNRPLEVNEIDFKPKQVRPYRDDYYVNLLAYKDARVDMDILDEIVGPGSWQNEYKRDSKNVLQCGIGIYDSSFKHWVWKWSNGTPSDFESEKGEYSDAFKRAGFMWGIGRCLYNFPAINVILNEKEVIVKEGQKPKVSGYFKPNEWTWSLEWGENEPFKIVAEQKFGNRKVERYNSNPYKK